MVAPDWIADGAWLELDDPPADHDELVLAVARRRGEEPGAVAGAFERAAERFDVDAVYVAPAPEASETSEASGSESGPS